MGITSFGRRARKLLRLLRTAEYRDALRKLVGAAIEHEGAMRSIEVGTLIDVGANLGQFSLLVRATHSRAQIHAFEPLNAAADKYSALFAGDENVTLHRAAAGEQSGRSAMNVSGRQDSSSLLPISAKQSEIFPGTAKISSEQIDVVRIDDVLVDSALDEPILIKLDVQGFELSALRGMPRLLARAHYVYAEVSFIELYEGQPLAHELIAWLAAAGFDMVGIYNPTFTAAGAAVQADALFARSVIGRRGVPPKAAV